MKATNVISVLMRFSPQSITSSTNTGSFRLNRSRAAAVILTIGSLTGGPLSFKLQSSADDTTFTDLTGKASASTTSSNKEIVINIDGEELPDGHEYVRGVVTLGAGASATVSALAIGVDNRYDPPQHIASVEQVV